MSIKTKNSKAEKFADALEKVAPDLKDLSKLEAVVSRLGGLTYAASGCIYEKYYGKWSGKKSFKARK